MVWVIDEVYPMKDELTGNKLDFEDTYIGKMSGTRAVSGGCYTGTERRRTEFELREGRVAVCNTLDPLRLVRLSVQRQAAFSTVRQLRQILCLFTLVLGPAPETDLLQDIQLREQEDGTTTDSQLDLWYAIRNPPTKPRSPPRRSCVLILR